MTSLYRNYLFLTFATTRFMDGDKTYAGREIVANDIIPIPRSITFSKAGYKKNKQKNR